MCTWRLSRSWGSSSWATRSRVPLGRLSRCRFGPHSAAEWVTPKALDRLMAAWIRAPLRLLRAHLSKARSSAASASLMTASVINANSRMIPSSVSGIQRLPSQRYHFFSSKIQRYRPSIHLLNRMPFPRSSSV